MRISDYSDYMHELNHLYCISSGKKKEEIKKQIFKEIAEKYEFDHPTTKRLDTVHDHDYDFREECYQRDLMDQRYEVERDNAISNY